MILAVLQARVSSTRLPGKVLKPILGRPMLACEIERIQRAQRPDRLWVATSQNPEDAPIEALCADLHVPCYRGSLGDVLDRFYQAAKPLHPEHLVRLTGDCPLIDPAVIDQTIDYYLKGGFDYVSNSLEPTFPDGLDVEVFRFTSLETAWKEASAPAEREHVTPFIYNRRTRFNVGVYRTAPDLSSLRWTVDEAADFELVRSIYEALYPKNPRFGTADILALLETAPHLKTLNASVPTNARILP